MPIGQVIQDRIPDSVWFAGKVSTKGLNVNIDIRPLHTCVITIYGGDVARFTVPVI